MTKPGPSVTSGADTQPGSDSLFPSGFGGGSLVRAGGVGTSEIADGSVAAADLNLASVAAAIAARSELTGTYATLAGVANTYTRRAPNTVIPLGTSITLQDSNGTQYANGTQGKGYLANANILLGKRLRVIRNAGISGNTSAQILARVQADVIAYNPAWCIAESGCPNDIGNSVPLATSISNHQAIYTALAAAGIRVVICTPLPYGLTDTTATRQYVAALRKWMITYARENGHVLCDWHPVVAASDGTGLWKTNYSDGVDGSKATGIHPTYPAAHAMGKVLATAMSPFLPDMGGVWLPASNADPYNLLANGMMTGTGGTNTAGGTGSVATSWTATNNGGSITGTLSKVARTDGVAGEWQQFTATAGNADQWNFRQQYTGLTTAWNYGDTALAVAEYQVDSDWVGGTDLYLDLIWYNAGTNVRDLNRGSDPGIGQPFSPGVLAVSGVIPSAGGAGALRVNIGMRVTTGTIRIGRVGLYNLTALAALGISVP